MSDVEYSNPLERIEGKQDVEIKCTTPAAEPELCDWDGEIVRLDAPAELSDDGERISLPGFDWVCPDCGNPHDFIVEGVGVSNLV
jgi:hypothetical protein